MPGKGGGAQCGRVGACNMARLASSQSYAGAMASLGHTQPAKYTNCQLRCTHPAVSSPILMQIPPHLSLEVQGQFLCHTL